MKAKDLAQLLEVIVRKVVREELKPMLKEIKSNRPKHTITELNGGGKKGVVKDPTDLDLKEIFGREVVENKKTSKPKTFVKNPMLNEMLNQTMNDGEWRTMDSQFGSNQAQRWVDNGSTSAAPTQDIDGRPVDTSNPEVANVMGAITKDYSQLMKAIDKKKGR
jgi:hypothetical protein